MTVQPLDWAWTRRQALLAGISTFAVAACADKLPDPPPLIADIPQTFIDIHCHVFNAHDIPVTKFLVKTGMREEQIAKIWTRLAPLVTNLVELYASVDDPELRLIEPNADTKTLLPKIKQDPHFEDLLKKALVVTADASRATPADRYALSMETDIEATARRREPDIFTLDTSSGRFILNMEAASLKGLFSDFGLPMQPLHIEHALAGPRGEISARSMFTDAALKTLGDRLNTEGIKDSPGFGTLLYVARQICQTRMRNIDQLDVSLGMAKSTRTRLYVPALVDFDCWYYSSPPLKSLSVDSQTQIMAKLSKLQEDPNRLVNGYVPFDPLRQVLVDAGILQQQSPLEIVREAVCHRGFIGVKLYPPMGFAAYNNSTCDNAHFGENVQPWIRQLSPHHHEPGGYTLGPLIDLALNRLFQFCLDKDVPIMAHCGNSQTSFVGSGVKASPENWKDLLNSENGKFRTLRLNLAHFGSLWCRANPPPYDKDDSSEYQRCASANDWPDKIIDLINEKDGAAPRYPNLYFDVADMGDLSIASTSDTARANLIKLFADKTADQREAIGQRMLYGTDWFFLALYGSGHVSYINDIDRFRDESGIAAASAQAVFSENAAHFLCLGGGKNADRLRKFYADSPERLDALNRFLQ